MKLIVRAYLAALKERGELDAVLPDLLSELGYSVYSRPGRGTTQYGVDVAAIGKDEHGERKLYLFSIKQGDLTRQDWDNGTPQALRPSLNEIRDVYIRSRIPKRYAALKIVICICVGGDIREQTQPALEGYISENSTDRIAFDVWNGDRIADLILSGILREEILPKDLRLHFQKAVAMVDEPDVAYQHFSLLLKQMQPAANTTSTSRIRTARQIYICLWILFVWGRGARNMEAPYRASEEALLTSWSMLRSHARPGKPGSRDIEAVLDQLIKLHIGIATEAIGNRILPHVKVRHGISAAVISRNSADINLKLFDVLGRVAMTGLWLHWITESASNSISSEAAKAERSKWIESGLELIFNNPTLMLPLSDSQTIDITLFLCLAAVGEIDFSPIDQWLSEMVSRLSYSLKTHGKYTCVFTDYRDLLDHPKEQTEAYKQEATSGSSLIPTLAAWLGARKKQARLMELSKLASSELKHCTFQLWLPDSLSEGKFYKDERDHGVALCDLPISATANELVDKVAQACAEEKGFTELAKGIPPFWPIILAACRHYRHPVPPQFWIEILRPKGANPHPSTKLG